MINPQNSVTSNSKANEKMIKSSALTNSKQKKYKLQHFPPHTRKNSLQNLHYRREKIDYHHIQLTTSLIE